MKRSSLRFVCELGCINRTARYVATCRPRSKDMQPSETLNINENSEDGNEWKLAGVDFRPVYNAAGRRRLTVGKWANRIELLVSLRIGSRVPES